MADYLNRTFVSIWVTFLTLFLVGCTCLPFSSPSSKTPVIGALSYSNIITYIETDTYGNPEWDGWSGVGDSRLTLSYSISPASENIEIDKSTGEITVLANKLFSNTYTVTVSGYGDFQENVSATLTIEVIPPFLHNVANVNDNDILNLSNAYSVITTEVEGITYLFVAGTWDSGISVFSVSDDGSLVNVENINDDDVDILNLLFAQYLRTTEIGGNTYLFVVGESDCGVSVFLVGGDGTLVNVDNVTNDNTLKLLSAKSLTPVSSGGNTYLYVAGYHDDGLSGFSVSENGKLSNVFNISDTDDINLYGPLSMNSAEVGGVLYLFVAGHFDDGVSVFSVSDDGSLINVANVSDDDDLKLDGVFSVTTSKIGSTTYLFVAGFEDDGVSMFSVSDDGSLVNVANVSDDDTLNLKEAREVATIEVEGTTYLFVASWSDSGISVFSVGYDGSLVNVANVSDDDTLQLGGASSLTTAVVGRTSYLFVSGGGDNGLSVFSINPQSLIKIKG